MNSVADVNGGFKNSQELLRKFKEEGLTRGLNDNNDWSQTTRDVAAGNTAGASEVVEDLLSQILRKMTAIVIGAGWGKD